MRPAQPAVRRADRRRALAILADVEGLRERNPELRRQVTLPALSRAAARDRTHVLSLPIEREAYVLAGPAQVVCTIAVNSGRSKAEQLQAAAHEYGHVRLHVRQPVHHKRHACERDPRDWEAALFASLLTRGSRPVRASELDGIIAEIKKPEATP
jgi:Zn-dependent peptidase ImmA (M78 family)